MNKKIKYISYFDFQDSPVKRNYVTSATNKMESICDILNDCGYDVDIISFSSVVEPQLKFYRGMTVERRPGLRLKLFPSWGCGWKPLKSLRTLWHLIVPFVYMLLKIKRDDTVLVYHSLGYFNTILWAKRIKKFKMILEVEELYLDVSDVRYAAQRSVEQKMIEAADAYIFPTELLDAKLNTQSKPSAIIYGTYKVESQRVSKFDDGKIHAVYAGTFDPNKGGAVAAVGAAEYLPDNYHVHICGFGTPEDTDSIRRQIEDIASRSKATISFDGLKLGKDYIHFIQRCHIGLSTQNPAGIFNDTSFPSKILSYMSNGLSVVSIDIPVVRISAVAKYITFYKGQTSQQIADAIINTPLKIDYKNCFKELSSTFTHQFKSLL